MWRISTVALCERRAKGRPARIEIGIAPGDAEPRMRNMANPEVSRGFLFE